MAAPQVTLAQARQDFFLKAQRRSQNLPRQNYVDGQSDYQFNLPKAGYGIMCVPDFQGTLTIAGSGGALDISTKAPFNLFKKVVFEDFLGTTRISCDGWKLYEREIGVRDNYDPQYTIESQTNSAELQEISIGGTGGAAGSYPLNTSVIAPISLHENTTRGTFPFAVPKGQNTITLTLNSLVGSNLDSLLVQTAAGFTATLTGTIGMTYYYWDVPSGTVLPTQDFQEVHELRAIREDDNIAANQEKVFYLPTGRTYYALYQDMVLNGAMDTEDITRVRFLVDGDTPYMDEYLYPYKRRIRHDMKRDMPVGEFLFPFWRKPWTPNNYGSLGTSLSVSDSATTSGLTYTEVLLESMYQANNVTVG